MKRFAIVIEKAEGRGGLRSADPPYALVPDFLPARLGLAGVVAVGFLRFGGHLWLFLEPRRGLGKGFGGNKARSRVPGAARSGALQTRDPYWNHLPGSRISGALSTGEASVARIERSEIRDHIPSLGAATRISLRSMLRVDRHAALIRLTLIDAARCLICAKS